MKYFQLILALAVTMLVSACKPAPIPSIHFVAIHEGPSFPTEVIHADGKFWVAQLREDTLFTTSKLPFNLPLTRIEPESPLASPHFMVADDSGVYVSEGRGEAIRYFSFDGKLKGQPLAITESLQRPHGLCIRDDWLYIADSVGSRLLRTHLKNGRTEVFPDLEKKIAYGRQLLCRKDGIWLSNSYEKAFPLNDGVGSNVLRITDFTGGHVETVIAFPGNNATGIAILDDRLLLIGRWNPMRDIVAMDLTNGQLIGTLFTSNAELDSPYSMFVDEENRRLYVAFLGINPNRSPNSRGAILEWKF